MIGRVRSIRMKLTLTATCVVAISGLLFGAISYAWLANDLEHGVDAFALHEAGEIAHVVASAAGDEELSARQSIFASLFPEEGVLSLEVWSLDGRLVLSLPLAEEPPFPPWPEGQAAARRGETPLLSTLDADSQPARRAALLVNYGGEPRWISVATVSTQTKDETLARFLWTYTTALVLAVSVLFLGCLLLLTRALSPVQDLARDVATITREGTGQRLASPPAGSELHELAVLINRMLGRIDETLERLRRFASYAGHELRTPLTRIRAETELALQKNDPATNHDCLASVLEETEELRRIVDALLEFAREDIADLTSEPPTRVDTLLVDMLEQANVVGAERGVRVEGSSTEEVSVRGNRALLGRALWNLLDNAVKFAAPGGLVKVQLRTTQDAVEVEVSDDGPGLPAGQDPEDFFQPFATGDLPGRGHGLGLPLSRSIARRHGGDLTSQPCEQGARFLLRLPKGPAPTP